jgi:hypothetical protein
LDTLERFPRPWCDTCGKVQPVTLDGMPANEKNPHAAADIVCDECKSIIATLHAPSGRQASARPKRAAKAREMAGQALDRLIDASATTKNGKPASEGFSRDRKSSVIFETSAPSPNADILCLDVPCLARIVSAPTRRLIRRAGTCIEPPRKGSDANPITPQRSSAPWPAPSPAETGPP